MIKAHDAGISHRSLSADTMLVGHDELVDLPTVWLTSWELGEVATSELAKRIDCAQLVALLAPIVGAERAVASAFRAVGGDGVEQFAPMLQAIVLPRGTRSALRASDTDLGGVRKEIVERLPDADIEPEKIARFGLRTVLTIAAGIVAAYLVFASFNTEEVLGALREANPWWLLVALAWSMATFIGAAVALMAFSPDPAAVVAGPARPGRGRLPRARRTRRRGPRRAQHAPAHAAKGARAARGRHRGAGAGQRRGRHGARPRHAVAHHRLRGNARRPAVELRPDRGRMAPRPSSRWP